MSDFKVLIVRDNDLLVRKFEVHCTDIEIAQDIVESYLNFCNDDYKAIILTIV